MHGRDISLMVLAVVAMIGCSGRPHRVTPTAYELAEGFVGWVTITFARPGAPPLTIVDGVRLIQVPRSGRLETSSPQEVGVVDNRFYYVDDAGHRTTIEWPEAGHGADPAAADRTYPRPVVLRLVTGDAPEADGRRVFEQFYVGPGPAGDPPAPW